MTFKVCLAFKLQFLKIEKFNNFDDFKKLKNIIYSTYMVFFIIFLDKTRVLTRKSCQNRQEKASQSACIFCGFHKSTNALLS